MIKLFSEKVIATLTNSDHNILQVESYEEAFFDVYEFELNGQQYIRESIGKVNGNPVISVPVVENGKEYELPFVLTQGPQKVSFNKENFIFAENVLEQPKIEEIEQVIKENSGVDKAVNINYSVPKEELFADFKKEREASLKDLRAQNARTLAEVERLRDSILTENKSDVFKLRTIEQEKLDNYIADKLSDISRTNEILAEKIERDVDLTLEASYSDVVNKIIDARNELKQRRIENVKLVGELTTLEKAHIELQDTVSSNQSSIEKSEKAVNKALSRLGQTNKSLEESKKEFDSIKHALFESIENAGKKVEEVYAEKANEVGRSAFANIRKSEIIAAVKDSKVQILTELKNTKDLKKQVDQLIQEGIDDAQYDPEKGNKEFQKEIRKNISKQFSNEMMNIKRMIEYSAGGGTNAVQYKNGGTMDGDLNVTGNILSGGINLYSIFGSGGGGGRSSVLSQGLGIQDFTYEGLSAVTVGVTQSILSGGSSEGQGAITLSGAGGAGYATKIDLGLTKGDSPTFLSLSGLTIKSDAITSTSLSSTGNITTTGSIVSAGVNIDQLFGSGGGGAVSKIVAGTNVTISPTGGTGDVTINATGGGGSGSDISGLSGSWQSTYTTMTAASGNWEGTYSTVQTNSASWGGTYDSSLASNIAMTEDVGGLATGTTVASLTGSTFSALFDTMLFPTVDPIVGSNNSYSLGDNVSNLQTIGAVINITLNSSAGLGKIKLNGANQADYAGDVSAVTITGPGGPYTPATGPGGTDIANASVTNHTVTEGSNSWSGTATFGQGPMPLDSAGNDFPGIRFAGGTKTNSTSFEGVYPIRLGASTGSGDFTSRSLTSHGSNNIECSQDYSETVSIRHRIAIPDDMIDAQTVGWQQYNALTESYSDIAASNFTESSISVTIEGNSVGYKLYTKTGAPGGGDVSGNPLYRIKFS